MTEPWRVKRYNGSTWVDLDPKKWNGSSFIALDAYYWDGDSWNIMTDRTPPTSTHTDTYTNTWSDSYQNNNSRRDDSEVNSNGKRFQGYYSSTWGHQKTMYGFNYGAIDTALTGNVAIYFAKVQLDNTHFYYDAGGDAVIGTHNYTGSSSPSTFTHNRFNNPGTFGFSYGQQKYVTVTNSLAGWFIDGSARGLVLYANSTNLDYYGYFTTTCRIQISYEK